MRIITDSEIRAEAEKQYYEGDIFEVSDFINGANFVRSQIEDQTEQWIDATLPPKTMDDVLIVNFGRVQIGWFNLETEMWVSKTAFSTGITAWQPLPQPPTERKEQP